MTFGATLRQARTELGWTQPELARRIYAASDGVIDLTPGEISRYETGRVVNPRMDVVRAAAKATNRSLEFFATGGIGEVGLRADTFRGGEGHDGGGRAVGASPVGEAAADVAGSGVNGGEAA